MNTLGAAVTIVFYLSVIAVFLFRMAGWHHAEYGMGLVEMLLALPLIYLLVKAPGAGRQRLYYVQIILMLFWIIVELLLDYILKIEFRQIRWAVIAYVILFFAASGGMMGIASLAGQEWTIISGILFLIMAVLAFVQRAITGK